MPPLNDTNASNDTAQLDAVNAQIQRIQQHQNAGRLSEAETALKPLLATYPDHPTLLHLKALNLALNGHRTEAMALLQKICDAAPDNAMVRVDYAGLQAQSGQLDEALENFQLAAEQSPNYALAHANLGAALLMKQKYDRAITHLERAIVLDPDVVDAHLNLAQAYIRTSRFQNAVNALFRALAIDPLSPAAHINLAHALFRTERHDAAEHHARKALEMVPNSGEAWMHLGSVLAAAGRMDEAADALLKSAAVPPAGMNALSRLVHLRKTTADSPEWALLMAAKEDLDSHPLDIKMQLAFALGKASEDMGDHASAFGYYEAANRLTREIFPYNREVMVSRSERVRSLVDADFVARYRGQAGLQSIAPIFVCGLPRSGTTLTEQMFSRHPRVQAGGELSSVLRALGRSDRIREVLEETLPDDALTADDFTRLGENYGSFLQAEGLRGEYVTDKLPVNYMYIGLMALALPRARFLILRRHPLDVLLSNWTQNFGQNQRFSTSFADLAANYDQFDRFAKHWAAVLPDQVRVINYEDLVDDPDTQMRENLSFAGLEWSEDVLDHTTSSRQVNTASVAQVRKPIYKTSVARWRQYGPLLHELADALGDHLTPEERAGCGLTS
jgi:tetratricopeptide (TPR) repeat protein